MGAPVARRHDEGGGGVDTTNNDTMNNTTRCGRFCDHMKSYPTDLKAFFVELIDGYGGKFVAMLAIVYFCVKGFANNATSYVMLPFYKKSLKVPAAEYQKYFNVANMAFSLKPLVGVISDLVPIFGFHKRFYVVIMALLGAGCLFCVTILPASDTASSGPASAGLLFVFFSGVAGMDLLMEGKYSEIMNLNLAPPSVVSFVWLAFSAGSLLGTGIEGPLADYASPELVMWISVPFFATAAIPALLGWLPEKRIKGGCCGSDACSFICCCFSGRSMHSEDCEEGNTKREGVSITAPLRGGESPSSSPKNENDEINENGEVGNKRYGSDENITAEVAARRAEEEAAREAIDAERIASRIRNAQPALSLARICPCLFGNKNRRQAGGYADMDGALVASSSEVANNPELLDSATQHKGVAMLGIMTAMCSLTMALITLLATQTALITFIIPAVVVLVGLSLFILPKAAAMANLYMFARELSYLQITGFLDYFFTSDQQCLPGGPDFSFTYYQTTVNVLSSVGTFFGAIVFQKFLSGMTFRRVFWLSNTLKMVASLFDLILTKRWNIDIGINDHVVFLCGDAIIYPICTMLDFMPASVLLSRLCPPGMECTMFALLASFSNFGQSISRSFGYMLAEKVGIRTEVSDEHPHCDFDKLWLLVVVGHIAMPTANYVLAYFLIPDTPMSRNVAGAGVEDIESDDGEAGDALIRNDEENNNHRVDGDYSNSDNHKSHPASARTSVRRSTSLTAALLRRSGAGAPHRQRNHEKLDGDDDLYNNDHVIGTEQSSSKRASVRQSQTTSGRRSNVREEDGDAHDEEDPYRHEGGHRQRDTTSPTNGAGGDTTPTTTASPANSKITVDDTLNKKDEEDHQQKPNIEDRSAFEPAASAENNNEEKSQSNLTGAQDTESSTAPFTTTVATPSVVTHHQHPDLTIDVPLSDTNRQRQPVPTSPHRGPIKSMSEENLDAPLTQNDHEERRELSPAKLQLAAELARKKHPERRVFDPVKDMDQARYSKEAADATEAGTHFPGGGILSNPSQAGGSDAPSDDFVTKGRHVRPRKTMHGVELQIETLSPIGSRVLLYSWYAVLIISLIIQGIPTAQWGCQNICGEKCDINHLEEIESYSCGGSTMYNVTVPVNETYNETILEQDVFWGGNGGALSQEKLSRFALIVLVMPRPNTTDTGDLSFPLNFALSISNVNSDKVKLGDVIGSATLSCGAGNADCDPIILPTNFAQAATNISSISVVLQEVPQSIADVYGGAAVSFVSQIPRYTIATIVIRYAGMLGSLLHLVRFIAHKKYTDDLYEQTWVLILHLGLFLYLDPLFAVGVYIRPSPQFMQFLEYRVPLYFLAVFVAFMYSLITSAMHWSSADVYHPPWKTKIIPFIFIAVVVSLDLADASLRDWDWSAEHCPRYNCTVPGYLMYVSLGLGVLICTVWLRWLYNNLGKKPYLESRPQQLACRLFIFIFVTVVMYLIVQIIVVLAVYHKISALVSYQPLLQLGPIMVFIAFSNILTFAYTTTVRSDKVPLKPTDPRWKRVYWDISWYQWLSLHGGSMYMFTNEIEEMLFYYIQEKHERERQIAAQNKKNGSKSRRRSKNKNGSPMGSPNNKLSPLDGTITRPSYAHYVDRYGGAVEKDIDAPPTPSTTTTPGANNNACGGDDTPVDEGSHRSYGAIQRSPRGRGSSHYDGELHDRNTTNNTNGDEGPTPFEQKIQEYEDELRNRRHHARHSAGEGFQLLEDHENAQNHPFASDDDDGSASIEDEEGADQYDPQAYYDQLEASKKQQKDQKQKQDDVGDVPTIMVDGSPHDGSVTPSKSSINRRSSRRMSQSRRNLDGEGTSQRKARSPTNRSPSASRRVHMEEPQHNNNNNNKSDNEDEEDEEGNSRKSMLPSAVVSMGKSMGRFVRKTMVDAPAHLLDRVEDKVMDLTAAALQLRRKPFFNLESCVDCFNLSWEAYGVKTSGGDMFVSTGIQIDLPDTAGFRKTFCCCGFGGGSVVDEDEDGGEYTSYPDSPSTNKKNNNAILGDESNAPVVRAVPNQTPQVVPASKQDEGTTVAAGTAYNTGGASADAPTSPSNSNRKDSKFEPGSDNASITSNPTTAIPVVTTPPICVEQYGYELIAVFEALDVQVLITKMACSGVDRHDAKKPRIMISFRGTDNASNAKQDLRIRRVTWPEMSSPNTNSYTALVNWQTYNPPSVHGGFLEAWSALRGTVLTEVGDILLHQPDDAEPLRVYITGHSLGGALAALCAYSLKRTLKIEAPVVYTFGQPRLGNKTFQAEYNKEIPETFRIVNESDVVSSITMFGGCHVGVEIGIDRNGNFISEPMFIEQFFRPTKGKGSTIANHTMTAYGESINAIANSGVFGECPSRCLEPYVSEDKVMALASRRVYHELRYTEKQKGNYDPELYQQIYEPKRSNVSVSNN